DHLNPFTIILILWILIFYIAGIYDKRKLRNTIDFFKTLSTSYFVNIFLAIALFYFSPFVGISPRTNLFIFSGIFIILDFFWKRYFNKFLIWLVSFLTLTNFSIVYPNNVEKLVCMV
ncbi:MAG: hypothetical protein ACK4MM_05955, partial [Fervidobacterium sp.]